MRTPVFFFLLVAWLGALSGARAQDALVTITAGYSGSLGSASLHLTGPNDLALDANDAGDQIVSREIALTLDSTMIFTLAGHHVGDVWLTVTASPAHHVVIEKIPQKSFHLPVTDGEAWQDIRVTISHRDRGPGGDPALGETGEIASGTPSNSSFPYLNFFLGRAQNGEALPYLRLAVAKLDSVNPWPVYSPDHPDIVDITAPTGTGFHFQTSQLEVIGVADTATPGNYSVSFCPRGSSTPFVTYAFKFPTWSTSNTGLKTGVVEKTVAGGDPATYVTQYDGYIATWGMIPGPGDYPLTITDWHVKTKDPKRVRIVRQTNVHDPAYGEHVDRFTRESYVAQVTKTHDGSATGPVVAVRQVNSNNYFVGLASEPSSVHYISSFPGDTIDGDITAGPFYVTSNLANPNVPGVGGTRSSAGLVNLTQNYGNGQRTHQAWGDNAPVFNPTDLSSNMGTGNWITTTAPYSTDPRWINFDFPTSVEKKYNTTMLARSLFAYSEWPLHTAADADDFTLNVVDSTRYDYFGTGNGDHLDTQTLAFRPDVDLVPLRGQIYSQTLPTGAMSSYAYDFGVATADGFTADTVATNRYVAPASSTIPSVLRRDMRITVLSGTKGQAGNTLANQVTGLGVGASLAVDPIYLHPNRSTKTVELLHQGRLVRREVYVYTGGVGTSPVFSLLTWEAFTYTDDGRPKIHSTSNNTRSEAVWAGSRKLSETDEAGVVTTYTYDPAVDLVTLISRADLGAGVPAQNTAYQYDAADRVVKQWSGNVTISPTTGRPVDPSGDVLISSTEYDLGGRVKKRTVPGGAASESAQSAPTGVVTQYTYATGNTVAITPPIDGSTTTYTATGDRDVTETLSPGVSPSVRTTERFADGRVKSVAGSGVAVPEYYAYNVNGGNEKMTVTLVSAPGSGGLRPRVQVRDLLGRLLTDETDGVISGGASKPVRTTYGYNAIGQAESAKVEQYSAPGGTPVLALSAPRLTTYDGFGAVADSGLDLDPETHSGLQTGGSDRYTTATKTYEQIGTDWWSVSASSVYDTVGSSHSYVIQTKTRLSNFPAGTTGEAVAYDYRQGLSSIVATFDPSTKSRSVTKLAGDGTRQITTTRGGLTTTVQSLNDLPATPQTRTTTDTYDAAGRLVTSTDARAIVTAYTYHTGSTQVFQTTAGKDESGTVLTVGKFGYDSLGRLVKTVDAKGGTATTTYNTQGQVTDRGGTAVKPVHYVYDTLGQQTELWTYREGTGGTADKTKWEYDANTGWLTAKEDALGRRVTYAYTYAAPYKVVTTTSPRNGGTLKTTRKYLLTTGELAVVDYNDGTTDVGYNYTRTGQVDYVTEGTISTGTAYPATFASGYRERHFVYNFEQQITEMFDANWYGGLMLSRYYEQSGVPGRYKGFGLGGTAAGTNDRELKVTYGYDHFGRIGGVTASYEGQTPGAPERPAYSTNFTYDYVPNTDTWGTLARGTYTLNRVLETNRDALKSVTAKWGSAVLTDYVYQTNAAGERSHAMQRGQYFNDFDYASAGATVNAYEYSADGELTQATAAMGTITGTTVSTTTALPGRTFGYDYDTAGNRRTVAVGTSDLSPGATGRDAVSYNGAANGTSASAANALNQVMRRGTLKGRISGTATETATVAVSGATVTKPTGLKYWDAVLTDLGRRDQYAITATRDGTTTPPVAIWATVRPATEVFTYDEEGNLTRDALWNYEYDAENRLIRQTTLASADLTSAEWSVSLRPPAREIDHVYDYLGRRIEKRSYKDGGAEPVYSRRYVYDGWNLIAEFDLTGGAPRVRRSYVWGLDVANSLTATGGVGALILETIHTPTTLTTYSVASDGNGNVAALIDDIGAWAALYEYDPFGQLLRAEGAVSAEGLSSADQPGDNPFRFSTKYFERESGLLYYGYRFYDPSLGRFINRDTIGEAGGNNLYAFVGNSPVNRFDHLGQWAWWESLKRWWNSSPREGFDEEAAEAPIRLEEFSVVENRTVADRARRGQEGGGGPTVQRRRPRDNFDEFRVYENGESFIFDGREHTVYWLDGEPTTYGTVLVYDEEREDFTLIETVTANDIKNEAALNLALLGLTLLDDTPPGAIMAEAKLSLVATRGSVKTLAAQLVAGKDVVVRTIREADVVLKEALPNAKKVPGASPTMGPPGENAWTGKGGEFGKYKKEYLIDPKTNRVYGHGPENSHGRYRHINVKLPDGTKVDIHIIPNQQMIRIQ